MVSSVNDTLHTSDVHLPRTFFYLLLTSAPVNDFYTPNKNIFDVVLHLPRRGRCEYLLQERGQDFVHQIQARFPRLFEQVSKD